MKVRDLKKYVYDIVCVYRKNPDIDGEYIDIYKGLIHSAPKHILDLDVRIIGAKRKDVMDIEVN